MQKLTRQQILDKLPEHLKGRTLHIVGPEDDYDEEEPEEIDPEYDQMRVPEAELDKRMKVEQQKEKSEGLVSGKI